MKKVLSIALCAALVLAMAGCGGAGTTSSSQSPDPVLSQEPSPSSATDRPEGVGVHHVDIEIADYGTIKLELDGDTAPITVENFLTLAGDGFYDGLTFHRIMAGFMMQGGDPQGDGFGGSENTIQGEFSANGVENDISHVRGTISMARNGADMNSASSQFFIVHEDSTFLDGQYAAFGHVTEGMEVVDAICQDAQPTDGNGTIPAEAQPVITSITVVD